MSYSDHAVETWCHVALDNAASDYSALVHYATLAASSHNTQPWIFKLETNRIGILPDLSRRCPAVDPDDHHLYASLGCATENLLLAAEAAGLKGRYACDASTSGVQIDFEETAPFRSPLFEVVPKRPEFARFLGIENCRPDLMVRIGRGPETPRSLRRPVEQVIA